MNELYEKVEYMESSKIKKILEKKYPSKTKKQKGTTLFGENFGGYLRFMKKGNLFIFTEKENLDVDNEVIH